VTASAHPAQDWKGCHVQALDVVGVPAGGLGTIVGNLRKVGGYPAYEVAWQNGKTCLVTIANFRRISVDEYVNATLDQAWRGTKPQRDAERAASFVSGDIADFRMRKFAREYGV
jgi:hypothetical protein